MEQNAPNSENWWTIVFENVRFPPTVMGISVLTSAPVTGLEPHLRDWLLNFSTCRGVTRKAPAEECEANAKALMDFLLEHRSSVLAGIAANLGTHGFEPESTFRDWFQAMQRIAEISETMVGHCAWSAPFGGRENKVREHALRMERFLDSLE